MASLKVVSVRQFELILLDELGYGIDFGYEAISREAVDPEEYYSFVNGEGFHKTTESTENSIIGLDLLKISEGDLQHVDSYKMRDITRCSLRELLGDKPLKSRSLFRGVAR